MADREGPPVYPLYNTTYTAYRVSPVHHGDAAILDEANLTEHARNFRQTLRGDSFRGVPLAFDEYNQFSRSGALQDCTWDLLGDERTWQRVHTSKEGEDNDISTASVLRVEPETLRGVRIGLQYERASHSALLLRDPEADDFAADGFTSLPLLLVRMPASLREILVDYLSKTFDCRVSPLRLPSSLLTSSLESLLRRLDNKTGSQTLASLTKGVQLQLNFSTSGTLLRNLDITIAKEDVPEFIARGKVMQSASAKASKQSTPFTSALMLYLDHHLGLDMAHTAVQVSKAIAGPFALSSDGKIKLFEPSPPAEDEVSSPTELAMHDLYTALCTYSAGEEGSLVAAVKKGTLQTASMETASEDVRPLRQGDPNASRLSPLKKRARVAEAENDEIALVGEQSSPRKRVQLSVPAEPPPPYELFGPLD